MTNFTAGMLNPGRELDALIAEKVMGCRGIYRYDLNLRRGGKLRSVRCAQKIQSVSGTVVYVERDATFVWDRWEMVSASIRR